MVELLHKTMCRIFWINCPLSGFASGLSAWCRCDLQSRNPVRCEPTSQRRTDERLAREMCPASGSTSAQAKRDMFPLNTHKSTCATCINKLPHQFNSPRAFFASSSCFCFLWPSLATCSVRWFGKVLEEMSIVEHFSAYKLLVFVRLPMLCKRAHAHTYHSMWFSWEG